MMLILDDDNYSMEDQYRYMAEMRTTFAGEAFRLIVETQRVKREMRAGLPAWLRWIVR